MTESSIQVAVRIRPFNGKERALLAPVDNSQPFLGDGGLAGSPTKSQATIAAMRSRYIRNIVMPVDDKVLVFDPAEPETRIQPAGSNPSSAAAAARLFAANGTGARRARDVRYAFDRVFPPETGQRTVFAGTVEPLLDGVLQGFNASVFAYGATGCGKTHTISGTSQDPGIIFLTMQSLYGRIEADADEYETQVRLSYLEIYNEAIRDLLSPTPTPKGPGLALREDAANKISVVGITEHIPESPEQVLEMITEGNRRRTQSPTEANAVSSRSHAVLQLNITRRPRTAGTVEEMNSASLNIIDLAGSERASATNNNGMRMKEGANINRSLLALGSCINALCQGGTKRGKHVPYRNSKLTRLLKFSLGGNCKTVMIVCVSPSSAHYDETHNTLKYANQAKNIQTKVTRNILNVDRHVAQYVQAIHSLREEVQELKGRLAQQRSDAAGAESARREQLLALAKEHIHGLQTVATEIMEQLPSKCVAAAPSAAASLAVPALRARIAQLDAELEACPDAADIPQERQVLASFCERCEAAAKGTQPQPDPDAALSRNIPEAIDPDSEAAALVTSAQRQLAAQIRERHALLSLDALRTQVASTLASYSVDLIGLGARSSLALSGAAAQIEFILASGEADSKAPLEAVVASLKSAASSCDRALTKSTGESVRAATAQKHLPPNSPARVAKRTITRSSPRAKRANMRSSPLRSRPSVAPRRKSLLSEGTKRVPPPRPSLARPALKPTNAGTGAGVRAETRAETKTEAKTEAGAAPTPTLPPAQFERPAARPRASVAPAQQIRPRQSLAQKPAVPKLRQARPSVAAAPPSVSPLATLPPVVPEAAPPKKRGGLFQRNFLARDTSPNLAQYESDDSQTLDDVLGTGRESPLEPLPDSPEAWAQRVKGDPLPVRFRVEPFK
ncbi:tubulin-dependent ATPase kip3 [Malassezia cuniculi]|uniref:Kinesin-like protein n=1 Tax=Malassezia cuniculi TaxID=948313 RepID=A0AAF0ERV0_9BASI|nr:tubulin-dependent ATPase kip3 [Malassezia cuniculi]